MIAKPTPREIESTPAGPEMDALVAELVMGWKYKPSGTDAGFSWSWSGMAATTPLEYSTDAELSLLVTSKWRGDVTLRRRDGVWIAEFTVPSREFSANAETLPLAICRAALKAALVPTKESNP